MKTRKTILRLYLLISLLLAIDVLLWYRYKISLAGYYSDVVLFWLWLGGSIAVIISSWKHVLAKLLLATLVLGIVLSVLPMGIPFYALVLSNTSMGLWMNKKLNDRYRAQIVGYSVMTIPWLEVIERKGLLEQRIFMCGDAGLLSDDTNVKIRYAKDILLQQETDSTLTLVLFYGGPNKTVVLRKQDGRLLNRK